MSTHRLDDIKAARQLIEKPKARSSSLPNFKLDFQEVKNRTTAYVDNDNDHLLCAGRGPLHSSLVDLRRSSFGTVSLQGDITTESKKSKKSKKDEKK